MGKRFTGGKTPQQHEPRHGGFVRGRGRQVTIAYDSEWPPEKQGGLIDKALRQLKRKVQDDGVLKEVEVRQTFTKPNEQRRLDAKRAIQREKRRQEAAKPKRKPLRGKGGRHGR